MTWTPYCVQTIKDGGVPARTASARSCKMALGKRIPPRSPNSREPSNSALGSEGSKERGVRDWEPRETEMVGVGPTGAVEAVLELADGKGATVVVAVAAAGERRDRGASGENTSRVPLCVPRTMMGLHWSAWSESNEGLIMEE